MATFEKRISNGKTTYRAKIRLKGHPSESGTFEKLTDARKWAQDTESAIRNGRYFQTSEAKRHTLGELIDRYKADVLPQKRSTKTPAQQLDWWKNQAGHLLLSDLPPSRIAELRDTLAREPFRRAGMKEAKARTPATVNRYLAALSHALTVAVKDWGWIPENPATKVTKPREPRGRVRFLSDEERSALVNACRPSQGLYTAFMLALTTLAHDVWRYGP